MEQGSSPHTRGAQMRVETEDYQSRIIPAYAGSTNPHLDVAKGSGGSSPHTRGAHENLLAAAGGERIIPAYAGSTP